MSASVELHSFSATDFHTICDTLAQADEWLASVIAAHGYPPMWTRANTFESLVHIILEQQVSLASALAALRKLQEKTGNNLTPQQILALTDEELRACYVSRQKAVYIRALATALDTRTLVLDELTRLPDDTVRAALTQLKGIGNWTADVYLMFVLQRTDLFPIGDLAAVNALKKLKALPKDTTREAILDIAAQWAPYRTVACMILWHFYLSAPRKKAP